MVSFLHKPKFCKQFPGIFGQDGSNEKAKQIHQFEKDLNMLEESVDLEMIEIQNISQPTSD